MGTLLLLDEQVCGLLAGLWRRFVLRFGGSTIMLTNEYDFDVYGADTNVIRLTAYRLYYDFEGNLSTNYDDQFFTLTLTRADDEDAIMYLIRDLNFYQQFSLSHMLNLNLMTLAFQLNN